ncbi:hypothetical protein [Polyangium sp. 6x1]|uniref:hypothetical protein n=1 Tax=Polyangium sp. 6x1 TaxID=3042689 RepID=UPI0024829920|nr:hypothetical protein [Polyangium sp. 6x1]MDI1445721.1 hypothetical protein [Polyangium sp. 6x1]
MSGNPGDDRDALIEALASAYRARGALGEVRTHPAFHDLDDAGRAEAFEVAHKQRVMEAALHPEGLSTTARAVLARIRGGG